MKKTFTFAAMLLAVITANAQDANKLDSLSIGDYDGLLENGDDSQCYQGSFYDKCPTTFYLKHTGTQIIYTKEELANLAGKDIVRLKYPFNNLGGVQAYPRTVKVSLMETDATAFEYDSKTETYKFFDYDKATNVVAAYDFDYDFSEIYGLNGEFILNFDKPFTFNGDKNLLVVITCDGEDTSESPFDVNFFCNSDIKNRAMTYVNDNYSFDDFKETEDWPNTNLETGTKLELPVTQLVFTKDKTSGISEIKTANDVKNATMYNIAGQKVGQDYKGLVIKAGKKYLKK